MNGQVQGLGGSKNRTNLRSPASHNINLNEDTKSYKKKYEETRELLKNQKRINELLGNRVRQLEQTLSKQDRQLQKKEEINEVLLQRIKCLKNALSDMQSKKSHEDTSYEQKNAKSNKSSTSNEQSSLRSQPVVGGYFGSIFN